MSAPRAVTSQDARTLRRGALTVLLLLVMGKGLPALRTFERNSAQAAREAASELATLRAAASGVSAMKDSLAVRAQRLARVRASLLQAPTPQLAVAELAASLGEYAEAAGARINATSVRTDSAFSRGMARVAVRLSVSTDIQGIASILYSIASDPRRLAVRDLAISGNEPGAPETRAETLVSELLVEGLALELAGGSAVPR